MISRSRGSRLAEKRASAVAVLTSTVVVAASMLTATPATAITYVPDTAVAIAAGSQNVNHQVGATATLDVTYTPAPGVGTPVPIYIAVLSGPPTAPATPPFPAGDLCTLTTPGNATCSITNNATNGTNSVEVFADNDVSGTLNAGDVSSSPTTVIFSGLPASVSLTPATSSSTNGTCVLYTLTALDNHSQPAVARPFTLAVTENSTTTPGSFTFYNADCQTPSGLAVAETTTSTSVTDTVDVVTASDGTAKVGIASNAIAPARVGTGQIKVTSDEVPTVGSTATATWTAGGADAVSTLTASPTTAAKYVGTTQTFVVTATDQNGHPVQGVTVKEQTEAGSADVLGVTSCGVTNSAGVTNCSITNGGTAGPDVVDFWVDNNLTGPHTPGPDPEEPEVSAGVYFSYPPTIDYANSSLKCVDQLAADKGTPIVHCTLPTTQHSVTFTATVVTPIVAPAVVASPVPGVVVDFTVTSEVLGGSAVVGTLPTGSATTDANGKATFTVNDPNPADGDDVFVSAAIGPNNIGNSTATWKTPVASAVNLTPPLQTITKGGSVTVGAQVADQFGSPIAGVNSLFYFVTGPDSGVNGNITTSPTGAATITYTSAVNAVGQDIVNVDDITPPPAPAPPVPPASATVVFVAGSTAASTVTVDTTGNGTGAICPSTTGTPHNTNLRLGISNTNVCALIRNANGEALAGKTVTFQVDSGLVDAGNPTATSTSTFVTTTNQQGIAMATVSSTKSGTQTVTATADSASGSGTLSYAPPTADQARVITVSPVSATLTGGQQQKFTWTVVDQYGNPVGGVTLLYTQSGAGSASGTSSGLVTTAADGTAAVTITTTSADNGAGAVSATIQQPQLPLPLNHCNDPLNTPVGAPAGNCTASATYTVTNGLIPTSLSLSVAPGVTIGHQETVTATVRFDNGTPAPNQVVRFLVTGANGLIGSAVTSAAGVATFVYVASVAGTDQISAYDDINDDQAQQGNEPGHHTKAVISGVVDRPRIHLTTFHGSVTVHVSTHPRLPQDKVTYFVKQYGHFERIGISRTGPLGYASMTFYFPKGVHRTFRARVASKPGIRGAFTRSRSITVR